MYLANVHWAAGGSAVVALVLVVVTAVLVAVTTRQVGLTRKAVEETARAADETARAADATRDEAAATLETVKVAQQQLEQARLADERSRILAREAVRARIDQQAPRVVVTEVTTDKDVLAPSEVAVKAPPTVVGPDSTFTIPTENGTRLFVRGDVRFGNEGRSSAVARVSASRSSSGVVIRTPAILEVPVPGSSYLLSRPISDDRPRPIPPGERGRLHIELEFSIVQWLESQPVTAEVIIEVTDAYGGVEDTIPVSLTAQPLERDTTNAGQVRRISGPPLTMNAGLVTRRYRDE